jgi:hypothetical protein
VDSMPSQRYDEMFFRFLSRVFSLLLVGLLAKYTVCTSQLKSLRLLRSLGLTFDWILKAVRGRGIYDDIGSGSRVRNYKFIVDCILPQIRTGVNFDNQMELVQQADASQGNSVVRMMCLYVLSLRSYFSLV